MNSKERRRKHREFLSDYRARLIELRLLGASKQVMAAFQHYTPDAKESLLRHIEYYRIGLKYERYSRS